MRMEPWCRIRGLGSRPHVGIHRRRMPGRSGWRGCCERSNTASIDYVIQLERWGHTLPPSNASPLIHRHRISRVTVAARSPVLAMRHRPRSAGCEGRVGLISAVADSSLAQESGPSALRRRRLSSWLRRSSSPSWHFLPRASSCAGSRKAERGSLPMFSACRPVRASSAWSEAEAVLGVSIIISP